MAEPDVEDVRRSLNELVDTLDGLAQRDPEQEVQGMAVPVLDAAIGSARSVLAGHPVADAVAEVITADAIALGEPVRAADALLVARQLRAALPPKPRPRARVW